MNNPWFEYEGSNGKVVALQMPSKLKPMQIKALSPASEKLLWVKDGEIQEISLLGFIEDDNRTLLTLPLIEKKGVTTLPLKAKTEDIIKIIEELSTLEKEGDPLKILTSPLELGGIMIPEAGGIAFFKPAFALTLTNLAMPEMPRIASSASRPGKSAAPFSVSTLLYQSITGQAAFAGSDEDQRERIQRKVFTPISAFTPEINQELKEMIRKGLEGVPEENFFTKILPLLSSTQDKITLAPAEREKRMAEAVKVGEKREKKHRRRVFLRRRGILMAVTAVVTIVVGIFAGTIISKALEPPVTIGWTENEVIRGYYQSVNDLDHQLMSDLIKGSVSGSREDQVMHLYATYKIVESYEGKTPYYPAEEWDSLGRPPLEPGQQLRGILNIEIEERNQGVYRVTFEEWVGIPTDEEDETLEDFDPMEPPILEIHGNRITEDLTLELYREAWVITGIEEIKTTNLEFK